jgi:spore germination cell wall hydrolase CwlJ-like protein
MLYSQTNATIDVARAWKALFASLLLIMVWQYFNAQALASVNQQEIVVQETEIPQEPTPEELYAEASFLDIVPLGDTFRYTDTDLFCMAKNIYHEARGESTLGKYAVAQVTMNRVRDPRFRNTVCDVVFQPYQFSWANNKSVRWTRPSGPAWNESMEIAKDVLEEGATIKGMENALYFHANYVRPNWRNVRKVTKIGAHVFYNQT